MRHICLTQISGKLGEGTENGGTKDEARTQTKNFGTIVNELQRLASQLKKLTRQSRLSNLVTKKPKNPFFNNIAKLEE